MNRARGRAGNAGDGSGVQSGVDSPPGGAPETLIAGAPLETPADIGELQLPHAGEVSLSQAGMSLSVVGTTTLTTLQSLAISASTSTSTISSLMTTTCSFSGSCSEILTPETHGKGSSVDED